MNAPLPSDRDFLRPATLADDQFQIEGQNLAAQHLGPMAELESAEDIKPRKGKGAVFWVGAGWLLLLSTLALLAPVLPLRDPAKGVKYDRATGELCEESSTDPGCSLLSLEEPFQSAELPLGTDKLGRDMLSQVIFGARTSLLVGLASIVFGIFFGGIVGLVAGYFGNRTESVLMGGMDVLLAFPPLVLALAIVTFSGSTVRNVVLAIGIVAIPSVARIVRSSTIRFKGREFVLASRTLGARNSRVVVREILPNVVPAVVAFSALGVAVAIIAEGSLAFLGLSVPEVTWGSMINAGRPDFEDYPYLVLVPCAALTFTVLGLNIVGQKLREIFDVKESAL